MENALFLEKYTNYYVYLEQPKLESIIWFGNVVKRLCTFSFSSTPFRTLGPALEPQMKHLKKV